MQVEVVGFDELKNLYLEDIILLKHGRLAKNLFCRQNQVARLFDSGWYVVQG